MNHYSFNLLYNYNEIDKYLINYNIISVDKLTTPQRYMCLRFMGCPNVKKRLITYDNMPTYLHCGFPKTIDVINKDEVHGFS